VPRDYHEGQHKAYVLSVEQLLLISPLARPNQLIPKEMFVWLHDGRPFDEDAMPRPPVPRDDFDSISLLSLNTLSRLT